LKPSSKKCLLATSTTTFLGVRLFAQAEFDQEVEINLKLSIFASFSSAEILAHTR
jgi:hypothetical protein